MRLTEIPEDMTPSRSPGGLVRDIKTVFTTLLVVSLFMIGYLCQPVRNPRKLRIDANHAGAKSDLRSYATFIKDMESSSRDTSDHAYKLYDLLEGDRFVISNTTPFRIKSGCQLEEGEPEKETLSLNADTTMGHPYIEWEYKPYQPDGAPTNYTLRLRQGYVYLDGRLLGAEGVLLYAVPLKFGITGRCIFALDASGTIQEAYQYPTGGMEYFSQQEKKKWEFQIGGDKGCIQYIRPCPPSRRQETPKKRTATARTKNDSHKDSDNSGNISK